MIAYVSCKLDIASLCFHWLLGDRFLVTCILSLYSSPLICRHAMFFDLWFCCCQLCSTGRGDIPAGKGAAGARVPRRRSHPQGLRAGSLLETPTGHGEASHGLSLPIGPLLADFINIKF